MEDDNIEYQKRRKDYYKVRLKQIFSFLLRASIVFITFAAVALLYAIMLVFPELKMAFRYLVLMISLLLNC